MKKSIPEITKALVCHTLAKMDVNSILHTKSEKLM